MLSESELVIAESKLVYISNWTTLNHTGPHYWTTLDHTGPHWTTLDHTTGPHWTTLLDIEANFLLWVARWITSYQCSVTLITYSASTVPGLLGAGLEERQEVELFPLFPGPAGLSGETDGHRPTESSDGEKVWRGKTTKFYIPTGSTVGTG